MTARTGVRARAAVATRADGGGRTRVTVLRSDGPLALRDTPHGVYLVGAAAGPSAGMTWPWTSTWARGRGC